MLTVSVELNLPGLEKFAQHVNNATGPIDDALKQWAARYRGFAQRRFDKYSKRGGDWPPLSDRTLAMRRGSKIPGRGRRSANRGKPIKVKVAKPIGARMAKLNKQLRKAISAGNVNRASALGLRKRQLREKKQLQQLLNRNQANMRRGVAKATHNTRERQKEIKRWGKYERAITNKRLRTAILRDTGLLFAALNPVLNTQGGIQIKQGLSITVGFGGPARHGKGGKGGSATIADVASFHNAGAGHLPKRLIIAQPPEDVLEKMAGDMTRALKKLADEVTN